MRKMSSPIKASQGSAYSRILGVGGARGNRVVDNAEMCTIIDSSDEWIQQRTGIIERRWVDDSQNTLSLATEAARKAIDRSGVPTDQIDAVLVSSVSNHRRFPSLAVQVASEFGLPNPAATDLSAACAGFCYGLAQAEALVRSGGARYALVIGVEELSRFTDIHDRSTAFLFADGAGAGAAGVYDAYGAAGGAGGAGGVGGAGGNGAISAYRSTSLPLIRREVNEASTLRSPLTVATSICGPSPLPNCQRRRPTRRKGSSTFELPATVRKLRMAPVFSGCSRVKCTSPLAVSARALCLLRSVPST